MTFPISSDTVAVLNPARLPEDASLIRYDEAAISWSAHSDGSHGDKGTIKTEEIFLIAEAAGGGYLILSLHESQSVGEEPFRLSSFLARNLPQDLLDQYLVKDLPDFLKEGDDSTLDVIVSIRSGTGLSPKFYDAVLQRLLEILGLQGGEIIAAGGGPSYQVTTTASADTVREFARERWGTESKRKGREVVILLSGDGGIVDLLNGMVPPAEDAPLPTIALLPLGTGNALFHSLHKPHYTSPAGSPPAPSHLVLALRALLRGRAAPLPTFQATFSTGSHLVHGESSGAESATAEAEAEAEAEAQAEAEAAVTELTGAIVASYGFHSQLVWESDTPAYRKHGAARFGMVAQELLKESHAYRAVVETEPASGGGRIEPDTGFNYILATMVSNLEKTFTISPHGRPLDGVLRLVHFGGVDGQRTMEIMMAAYDGGKHVALEGVGYRAVQGIKVTTKEEDARWRKVCIDGTIVEIPKDGSMTVKKSAESRLQVLVLGA